MRASTLTLSCSPLCCVVRVQRHFLCQYIKQTVLIIVILAIIGIIIGISVWQAHK